MVGRTPREATGSQLQCDRTLFQSLNPACSAPKERHDGPLVSPHAPDAVRPLSEVVRSALLVGFAPLERDGLRLALEARGVTVIVGARGAAHRTDPVDVAIVDLTIAGEAPGGGSAGDVPVVAALAESARRVVAVVDDTAHMPDLDGAAVDTVIDRRTRLDALLTAVLHQRDPGLPWSMPTVRALPLTTREREVLQLIAGGCTSKEIARTLGVSAHTVESHKQRVFRRLGVQNQAQAIAAAVRMGLLAPGSARGAAS
jgi:DNA-binding NarL/FixJ family response regulator